MSYKVTVEGTESFEIAKECVRRVKFTTDIPLDSNAIPTAWGTYALIWRMASGERKWWVARTALSQISTSAAMHAGSRTVSCVMCISDHLLSKNDRTLFGQRAVFP